MKIKHFYLILCILAVILTYSNLTPYLLKGDISIKDFIKPFFADHITRFYMMDLLITALAGTIFIIIESKKIRMPRAWIPIVSIFLVGISLALPLFLYMREKHLEKS